MLLLVAVALITTVGAASAAVPPSAKPPVVLLAVPGLVWADVAGMPQLRSLAARSSVAELSVKTNGVVTRCPAGLTTVSAGNRTVAPLAPTHPCSIDMTTWPALESANRASQYDARLGTLGATLQAAGVKTVAVGARAVPMLANTAGSVDAVVPSLGQALRIGGAIGIIDQRLYEVPAAQRPATRTAVDAHVAAVASALPTGSTLMVAGISDLGHGHAQLHALVLSGPGWSHTELRSSAAGRAPYVQLIDIAPTVLSAAGVSIPSYVVGRPMQRSGHSVPPVSSFVDDDRHAVLERTVGQRVFLLLGIVVIVMMVLAAGPVPVGHRIATWLARLLAPAPALVFLTNGLPWWRWGPWSYGAILLAGCVAVAAATTVATHRHRTARLLVVPVLTFAALAIDQLTGARLQLSSPLGESPLAAGRFSGMGNLDFAVMATSALIVAALVSARLRRGPAVLTAMALVVVAIVVDGAPQLGNDIGGVVTLIPAGFMLIALVADVTVTRLRVVTAVATTVTVAVGIALADYSRPPAAQTHVGRFVGQVLHGGAGTEVHRKFDAAIATFGWTTGTFVVGFTLAAWAIAHRRIMASLRQVPGATAAAVSAATLAVLGAALNDSGLGVAAMVVMVGVSALYAGFHPADRQTPVLSAPRGT